MIFAELLKIIVFLLLCRKYRLRCFQNNDKGMEDDPLEHAAGVDGAALFPYSVSWSMVGWTW